MPSQAFKELVGNLVTKGIQHLMHSTEIIFLCESEYENNVTKQTNNIQDLILIALQNRLPVYNLNQTHRYDTLIKYKPCVQTLYKSSMKKAHVCICVRLFHQCQLNNIISIITCISFHTTLLNY